MSRSSVANAVSKQVLEDLFEAPLVGLDCSVGLDAEPSGTGLDVLTSP